MQRAGVSGNSPASDSLFNAERGGRFCLACFDQAILLLKHRFQLRQLRVDDKAHGLAGYKNWVIRCGGRVFETCHDVLRFQIEVVFENFRMRDSGG
jgi:hypothetical protein